MPAADPAAEHQPVRGGLPDEHGAEPVVAAGLVPEPADDERRRSAGSGTSASPGCAVRAGSARSPLADDALEALLLRRLQEHLPVVVRRRAPASATLGPSPRPRAAASRRSRSGRSQQVLTVEAEQVEGDQRHRVGLREPERTLATSRTCIRSGQRTERRHALAERRPPRRRAARRARRSASACSSGKATEMSFSLRDQTRTPVRRDLHQDAHAVPLHLVGSSPTRWGRGRPWSRASAACANPDSCGRDALGTGRA